MIIAVSQSSPVHKKLLCYEICVACYAIFCETICRAGISLVHQMPTNCTQRLADASNCLLLVAGQLLHCPIVDDLFLFSRQVDDKLASPPTCPTQQSTCRAPSAVTIWNYSDHSFWAGSILSSPPKGCATVAPPPLSAPYAHGIYRVSIGYLWGIPMVSMQ